MTVAKSLNFSVPRFLHLQNRDHGVNHLLISGSSVNREHALGSDHGPSCFPQGPRLLSSPHTTVPLRISLLDLGPLLCLRERVFPGFHLGRLVPCQPSQLRRLWNILPYLRRFENSWYRGTSIPPGWSP